jgi:hypothetical protein
MKTQKPGFNNICVHKGLTNAEPVRPEIGHPADLPKAAKDPKQQFKPVPKDYEKRMTPELRRIMELPAQTGDNLSKIKEQYVALGVEPNNTRYGWIRK